MAVTPHVSLDAFFHEVVTDALGAAGVDASEHTEFYLVDMLGDFARARISDEPLSMKLAQVSDASPSDQIATLKEVGDTSLYVTGMFAESFDRRLFSADYYIGLGEAAYRQLASRLSGASAFEEVYRELSDKFPRFVDVLQHVRENVNLTGGDVMSLYDQYSRTRSDWIEQRLRATGAIVGGDDDGTVH